MNLYVVTGIVLCCFLIDPVWTVSFEDLQKDYDFAEGLRVECNQDLAVCKEENEQLKEQVSRLENQLRKERDGHTNSKNTLELRDLKVKHLKEDIEILNGKVSDRDKEITLLRTSESTLKTDLRHCQEQKSYQSSSSSDDSHSAQHYLAELHKARQEKLDYQMEAMRLRDKLKNCLSYGDSEIITVLAAAGFGLLFYELLLGGMLRLGITSFFRKEKNKEKTDVKGRRQAPLRTKNLDVYSSDEDNTVYSEDDEPSKTSQSSLKKGPEDKIKNLNKGMPQSGRNSSVLKSGGLSPEPLVDTDSDEVSDEDDDDDEEEEQEEEDIEETTRLPLSSRSGKYSMTRGHLSSPASSTSGRANMARENLPSSHVKIPGYLNKPGTSNSNRKPGTDVTVKKGMAKQTSNLRR